MKSEPEPSRAIGSGRSGQESTESSGGIIRPPRGRRSLEIDLSKLEGDVRVMISPRHYREALELARDALLHPSDSLRSEVSAVISSMIGPPRERDDDDDDEDDDWAREFDVILSSAYRGAPGMSDEDRKILRVFVEACDEVSSTSAVDLDLVSAIEAGLVDLVSGGRPFALSSDHRLKLESYASDRDADPAVASVVSRMLEQILRRSSADQPCQPENQ